MVIIAVKAYSDCFRKAVNGLSSEAETLMRKSLRIKGDPFSCGYTDIQEGKLLKTAIVKLYEEPEIKNDNSVRAVRQYINALDDSDQVVILDAEKYSNYDILCWSNALTAYKKGHNPVVEYHTYRYAIPGEFFPRHKIYFFADLGYDQYYGEPDKNTRINVNVAFVGQETRKSSAFQRIPMPYLYFLATMRCFL